MTLLASDKLHCIFTRFPENFPLPFILDGATGTALMRDGMPAGSCTESWVLNHPETLAAIQRDYRAAGSMALYTPTFGASASGLKKNGVSLSVEEANRRLAEITKQIACNQNGTAEDDRVYPVLTAGDLSPTGYLPEPYGDMPFDAISEIYAEQAAALDHAGVDFFAVETMISLSEARAAVIGVRSVSDKPIFVTLTVDKRGRTMSGDTLLCALLSLAQLGINAFGCNCSVGPQDMCDVLSPLLPTAVGLGIPLIAKPNAGMPHEHSNGSRTFDLDAHSFGQAISDLLQNGICVLGGCCGTDSSYIREITERVGSVQLPDFSAEDTTRMICTNRVVANLPDVLPDPIDISDDLPDDIDECEEDFLFLHARDEKAAEIFFENEIYINKPILLCGDSSACHSITRRFNGKTLVVS